MNSEPGPKKRKAKCLPPPWEISKLRDDKKAAAAKAEEARQAGRRKPRTTLEKIAAAQKAEMKAKQKARLAMEKENPKPKGMIAMLAAQSQAAVLDETQFPSWRKTSVLNRPTKRTRALKFSQLAHRIVEKEPTIMYNGAYAKSLGLGPTEKKPFPLLDLPVEIRARVWRLCVGQSSSIIWPHKNLDMEQPDLALTCRTIRAEVLPIFYRRNIFAIDITPPGLPALLGDPRHQILPMIRKWSKTIEGGGWSSHIKRWAFVYDSKRIRVAKTGDEQTESEGRSWIVSVHCSVENERLHGYIAEVHQTTRCIMPGFRECGQCRVRNTPQWLVDAVIEFDGETAEGCIGDSVLNLVHTIISNAPKVDAYKCETVMERIESYEPGSVGSLSNCGSSISSP